MTATWQSKDGIWHAHGISQPCSTACAPRPREWTITLPITTPLSLNDRTHWRVNAQAVRNLRTGTAVLVRAAKIPPLAKVEIELHYVPRDSRRRDVQNLVPTRKAAEDGVVDAGVIPDDTAEFSVPLMPVIDPPAGKASRMYLLVREVFA